VSGANTDRGGLPDRPDRSASGRELHDDARATEIVADLRERLDRGERVDVEATIRAHPGLEAKLRGRLAALAKLDRAFGHGIAQQAGPTAPPLTGRLLGPYRLDRALGTGGMGTVYLASVEGRSPGVSVGDRVAVKVVHPHLLQREGFFKRFLREAEIGRRLRHDNVVRTFDADAVPLDGAQAHFLVLEYVEGQTLRDLLAEVERAPEELCRHVGREIAKALVAIHAAGAVHRDLKPDNVLVTMDHVVKVMDLGVARQEDDDVWRLSQTGAFVGSVRYAAPEQFKGRGAPLDGRADLYALGLLLYEMATGSHPFAGDDFHVVMRRQMTETPRAAGEVNPQLSPFFEEVLKTLLQKEPEKRFTSAEDLLAALTEGEKSAWWHERAVRVRAETKRPLRRIRIPRETALYGREAEIAKLRDVYAKAKAGEGQVVLVDGEAGIGKSRLVDEFVAGLQREGEEVHFLFGSYPPGGAATASGAFSTAYREHFGEETLEEALKEALPVTPLLVPAFAALLRGDAAPKDAEPLTKDSLQTVFVHATRSLAKERTTIVLIDDLHFAPEEGRGLFASLALATPGHRILLVGTARPGLPQDWLVNVERTAHVTRLPIGRLGPKDLVRLLADTLKSERLAEELSGRIAVKSDGNPFFVFEILRGLREGQFLTQRPDGTWVTTQILHDIQVPSTIQDLVNARVADLDPDERNLLDVASCIGFEFDPLTVGAVVGMATIPVLRALGQIERKHRLVRSVGERFMFDHHQVQEALSGALSPPLAREYHAAIAEAIERRTGAAATEPKDVDGAVCVDLCEHFLRGARGASALRYLDAALSHLEKGYLNDQAIRLADCALAVPGLLEAEKRFEVLLRKADRLGLLGRRDAERAALDEALVVADASGEASRRARAHSALGWHLVRVSRLVEAEAVLREALELARAARDRQAEAAATGNLGLVFYSLGRFAESQSQFEQALALAQDIGDRRVEGRSIGNLGLVSLSLGRASEAQALFEQCLALARQIGDRLGEAVVTGNLGSVMNSLGRLTEAQAQFARSLVVSRELWK
jgi:serine/threonine protein kinase/tetratricopeptide (TPR) repeat protein